LFTSGTPAVAELAGFRAGLAEAAADRAGPSLAVAAGVDEREELVVRLVRAGDDVARTGHVGAQALHRADVRTGRRDGQWRTVGLHVARLRAVALAATDFTRSAVDLVLARPGCRAGSVVALRVAVTLVFAE